MRPVVAERQLANGAPQADAFVARTRDVGKGIGPEDAARRSPLDVGASATGAPSLFAQRFVHESSLIEELPLSAAALAEPWDVQTGHLLAYRGCVESAQSTEPLYERDIKQWQALTVREQAEYDPALELDPRHIGAYRDQPVWVGGREGAAFYVLPERVGALVREINDFADTDSEAVLAFAASVHLRYEVLHPFIDGNGRSGRLLAHWVLVRYGARPVLFTAQDRFETYYRCFDPRTSEPMRRYFAAHQVAAADLDALL